MSKRSEYIPSRAESTAERPPPHSIEAEQGVLGCLFQDPAACCARSIERLRAGSATFYDLRHQIIYATVIGMFEEQKAIDVITVQQKLKDREQLEQIGGIAYLAGLPDVVTSTVNLDHYLVIVREKHLLRRLLAYLAEAQAQVYQHDGEIDPLLMAVQSEISALTEVETIAAERHLREIMRANIAKIEEWSYRRGSQQIVGLTTGPEGNYLDKIIGGLHETMLMVLAGRPGSGKTSLALNIVKHVATKHVWWEELTEAEARKRESDGHKISVQEHDQQKRYYERHVGLPVAIFSLEMTAESLGMQLLFDEAGVDMAQYKQGFAKTGDVEKLTAATVRLAKANIYIDDSAGQNIDTIAGKARRMAKQYGIKLFVLDYLQLIETEGRSNDRVRELARVSNKIVALKKQLKVPWLVLAQMNRNIETSERERKPVMSDLKDCGAFEQDADLLLFTYKTPYKELNENKDGQPSQQEQITAVVEKLKLPWSAVPYRVDLIVAKNREGATGECQMLFQKNLRHFEDWHLWKVKHGVEDLKQGERAKVINPPEQGGFDDVERNFPLA